MSLSHGINLVAGSRLFDRLQATLPQGIALLSVPLDPAVFGVY